MCHTSLIVTNKQGVLERFGSNSCEHQFLFLQKDAKNIFSICLFKFQGFFRIKTQDKAPASASTEEI